jgi:ParB family transcriptional regulator, chromosome partitioning protein
MTTSAAQNLTAATAPEKKDEKAEKRRALGRGLESLLPGPRVVTANVGASQERPQGEQLANTVNPTSAVVERTAPTQLAAGQGETISISAQAAEGDAIVYLAIEVIDKNPYQTRSLFSEPEMIELRDSIREHGVVQPVVVRPVPEGGRYILVLGERRLRASKMAGKDTIPAIVRRLSPQQAAEMTVLENVVREDLNPMEQAQAYRVLSQEFNLTQAQIAQRIGVSRESVANYMRLLRLPAELHESVALGRIGFSEARELLSLDNPGHVALVAEELLGGGLKWGELKERIAKLNGMPVVPGQTAQPGAARWVDPNVRAAQEEMQRLLGVRVKIRDYKGHGSILIEYSSVDDYERMLEIVRAGSHS